MEGTVTVTPAGGATIHTYTAPESGWCVNSRIIELSSQLVLFDAQLTPGYAREVLKIAAGLGKPLTRLYISHAHPDHFVGAALVEAPSYALAPVKALIDGSGDVRIERGYQNTPGHEGDGPVIARPVDYVVEPGQEVVDGVALSFEAVADAETTEQPARGSSPRSQCGTSNRRRTWFCAAPCWPKPSMARTKWPRQSGSPTARTTGNFSGPQPNSARSMLSAMCR